MQAPSSPFRFAFLVAGALLLALSALSATAQAPPRPERTAAALRSAMEAVRAEDWEGAYRAIAPLGELGRTMIDWHRLRAGEGEFSEFAEFLLHNPGWPGLALLRKSGEQAIGEDVPPGQVISYFAKRAPQTGTGSLALAAALRAIGKGGQARNEILRAWHEFSLTEEEEALFRARYAALIRPHAAARQDMLIWRNLFSEAERLDDWVGPGKRALAKARIALLKNRNGVDALLRAIPPELRDDPGLAYARVKWRLARGMKDRAVKLMLARSTSAEALGDPQRWAGLRRSLARELMRMGRPRQAYEMASRHFLSKGRDYADLEWLAGFIALTDLKKPKLALDHFRRFRAAVSTPISLGRAGYWEGRAHEALGHEEEARLAYAFAAEFQTSFYGMLAAEKAGLPPDPALTGRERYPDWTEFDFSASPVFQVAILYQYAGESRLFARFARKFAESLSPPELGALAQLALEMDEPYAAVSLAKYAAVRGLVLPRPYFPLAKAFDGNLPVARELALAIARRESEFDPRAVSPAGAMGLMQLMPATARAMAKELGLGFDAGRLLEDPAYNIRLGSAYLARLIEEFGAYYPIVAAAYNAGPNRARQWLKELGDPRRSRDAVDWIEHIPFTETRNYVMRVMEGLIVYRARLSGQATAQLSEELRGR